MHIAICHPAPAAIGPKSARRARLTLCYGEISLPRSAQEGDCASHLDYGVRIAGGTPFFMRSFVRLALVLGNDGELVLGKAAICSAA